MILANEFQSPREEKVPDSNPDSDEKEEPKTIVLLRFSDDYVVEFRTRIQEASEALSLFGGELIALAPQVIWQYCKFGNFRENFIFSNSIIRNIYDVKNSRLGHDLTSSVNDRIILLFNIQYNSQP